MCLCTYSRRARQGKFHNINIRLHLYFPFTWLNNQLKNSIFFALFFPFNIPDMMINIVTTTQQLHARKLVLVQANERECRNGIVHTHTHSHTSLLPGTTSPEPGGWGESSVAAAAHLWHTERSQVLGGDWVRCVTNHAERGEWERVVLVHNGMMV